MVPRSKHVSACFCGVIEKGNGLKAEHIGRKYPEILFFVHLPGFELERDAESSAGRRDVCTTDM